MNFVLRRMIYMIGFIYVLLTAYIVVDYFFLESSEIEPDGNVKVSKNSKKLIVDIWGKASIAEYFWTHISKVVVGKTHYI